MNTCSGIVGLFIIAVPIINNLAIGWKNSAGKNRKVLNSE